MHRPLLCLTLLLLCLQLTPAEGYEGRHVRVFVLAGQSNMGGSGAVSEAPPEWRSQPRVLFDVTSAGEAGSTDWQTLGDAVGGMGPEIAFGAMMDQAYPDDQIAIVKVSRAATGLSYWRMPGNAGYDTLVARIATVTGWLNDAVASNDIPSWSFEGFVWMQGENEADGALSPSEQYRENFDDLATKVRAAIGDTDLPVILGRISIQLDPSLGGPVNQPQLDNVRSAQVQWAEEDGFGAWVDTDDLPLVDSFHWGSVGQLILGGRFAQAWFESFEARPAVTLIHDGLARGSEESVHFTAVFQEPVTGFGATDIQVSTETGVVDAMVSEIEPYDGTTYAVAVTGMDFPGVVACSIPAGAAQSVGSGADSLPSGREYNRVLWAPHAAIADLIVYDGFETEARPLHNLTSGSGWSGAGWNIQNQRTGYVVEQSEPLTYPGLATSPAYAVGGDLYVTSARPFDLQDALRPYMTDRGSGAVDLPGTSLWMSVLIKPLRSGKPQRIALSSGTGTTGNNQAVTIENSAGIWQLKVLETSIDTGVDATTGETHLFVLHLEIGGSDTPSTASLWLNPDPSLLGGAAPSVATATASVEVTSADFKFSRLFWYPGSANNDGAIDEVRLGLSFASVTPTWPAPEPYDLWREAFFTSEQLNQPAISGDSASPAGDGVSNRMKFAMGYSPWDQVVPLTPVDGSTAFQVQMNADLVTPILFIETSTDMDDWTEAQSGYELQLLETIPASGDLPERQRLSIAPPPSLQENNWFLRLRVD